MSLKWDVPQTGIDPTFLADLKALLEPAKSAWIVTRGLASLDEQKALYEKHLAGGPLAAPPGHSAHNFGLAVDVAALTSKGQASWNEALPQWQWLWDSLDAAPRLHSGYHFSDDDHIESTSWPKVKALLKASGKW